jgi:antitoxin HigA-1
VKTKLDILKGIHPGKIIERELLKTHTSKRQFALSVGEYPQTLGSIIKGKRSMNVELSLKIEQKLNFDEGFLMTLQVFYDIAASKKDENYKPDLSKLNKITFWDTTFDKIDWKLMKKSVIKRVLEYGNQKELEEITRFYGKNEVEKIKIVNHRR